MTRGGSESLRIGCVQYLNAQPLIFGWPGEVVFDHPSTLCRKLADGELDVAFVSSFEFLRMPVYTIVDGVALAADGAVHSVFVAHDAPIEEIDEIALDPASLTSVNLVRCLLAERQLKPRRVAASSDLSPVISGGRARLMIGDQAIRFREKHATQCHFWDLGAEWKRLTGLPFVFALWLIRPGVPMAQAIADQLRGTRDQNLADIGNVIAAQDGFTPEFCAYYFSECLRFGFGEAEKSGLLRFRSLCEEHGILTPNAEPLRLV